MRLSADDLMLGAHAPHTVQVPASVLVPGSGEGGDAEPMTVVLRPLVLSDIARIDRAGRDDATLVGVLMVAQAMVEPAVTVDQVQRMHAGLVEFLLDQVNRISGLRLPADELAEQVQTPLAKACFLLSREFGWTPDECAGLTLGQVLLYLEMLGRGETVGAR
jgi:hypothetical protein